jgi:hypothetical protein
MLARPPYGQMVSLGLDTEDAEELTVFLLRIYVPAVSDEPLAAF